ncbi:MAG: hypothetical protein UV60_C0035G0001 [Parcubacteria group bacterium GW2011_GWA2_43_11]|nr:MAG: hypothetical protein UU89_C0030G0001 [Parcubacteria group bacterium GW2011_GWC2_42_11]KKS83682.1 MAG: hypothetical protein UV60_C0035G0001 [Parcubacteria group bacterium GW2011_GWA2_43_11]
MKNSSKLIVLLLTLPVFFIGYQVCTSTPSNSNKEKRTGTSDTLTESEAQVIAEQTCIKGGGAVSNPSYNSGTKTWWYDANLNTTHEGCNPACVVSEATKTAEINWRCTGLQEGF